MSVSTLPSAGGLDVDELSNKLSTIPTLYEEGAEPQEQEGAELQTKEQMSSENSSTAAVFGSEAGMMILVIGVHASQTKLQYTVYLEFPEVLVSAVICEILKRIVLYM